MAEFQPGADAPAVIDTPVAAPPATEQSDSTAEQVEVDTPDAKPERTFTQTELNKIVQKEKAQESRRAEKMADARLRAEYAERQLSEYRQASQPKQPEGEPKPAQFQDYESYIAALTDYKFDQRMQGMQKQDEAQRHANTQREQAAQIQQKLSSAQAKYADFNEVAMADDVPITEPMAAAIGRLKDGGEVAYYLGSNIDEARRISRLNPVDQVWEIKELERKLTALPSTTKTPPPIVPTTGPASVKKDTFELPWSEFVKQRKKEIARR